jgi:hypothetical protein
MCNILIKQMVTSDYLLPMENVWFFENVLFTNYSNPTAKKHFVRILSKLIGLWYSINVPWLRAEFRICSVVQERTCVRSENLTTMEILIIFYQVV